MSAEIYTDSEFAKIVELRRRWLASHENAERRFELACEIDEIEYKDFTAEERQRIRNRKQQMANFAKVRMACPSLKISVDDFVTEEDIAGNRPPKLLFGVAEVAGMAATLCKEFKSQKIEAYSLDFVQHPLRYPSDLSRGRFDVYSEVMTMLVFVSELISEFDVFNVFGCQTLLYNIDLPVYRELDKKVVMHYTGQEARILSLAARNNIYLTLAGGSNLFDFLNRDMVNIAGLIIQSNYAHASLAYNNEFEGQLKLAYTEYFEIPQPIVLSDFDGKGLSVKNEAKFTIVHAAANADIKGSRYIAAAVDVLKEQYNIEYIALSNAPHEEAKAVYAKADLIIDQLILGWHGILSLEAMAMGKPVICYLCEEFFEQAHVKDIPIINADIDSIKDKIEWTISNKDKLEELGKKGLEYVKKNHDSKKIAGQLLSAYERIPYQKPFLVKFYKREDTQSMDGVRQGLLFLMRLGKDFEEFFITNGYKCIGLYGSNNTLGQAKALMNPSGDAKIEVGEFVPGVRQHGFDVVVLMMVTDVNKSHAFAQENNPQALVVTLSELIMLAV